MSQPTSNGWSRQDKGPISTSQLEITVEKFHSFPWGQQRLPENGTLSQLLLAILSKDLSTFLLSSTGIDSTDLLRKIPTR